MTRYHPAALGAVLAAVLTAGFAGLGGAAPARRTGKTQPPPHPAEPPQAAATCKKVPENQGVKLNLKADSEVADLIALYSTLTCTTVLVANNVGLAGKKVTVFAPEAIKLSEARGLILAALESVGLAVERTGEHLRVIEASKARSSAVPTKSK
jgi:hypothetical protein